MKTLILVIALLLSSCRTKPIIPFEIPPIRPMPEYEMMNAHREAAAKLKILQYKTILFFSLDAFIKYSCEEEYNEVLQDAERVSSDLMEIRSLVLRYEEGGKREAHPPSNYYENMNSLLKNIMAHSDALNTFIEQAFQRISMIQCPPNPPTTNTPELPQTFL